MNIFNFVKSDAIEGLVLAYLWGLFLGFLIGLIRYLVFNTAQRRERV